MSQKNARRSARSALEFLYGIPWNLGLLTAGAALGAVGVKAIIIPHDFISGGLTGLGLLVYYLVGAISPGLWYFLLNIPVYLMGWLLVSRRFFLYSLYGMSVFSLAMGLVHFTLPVRDPMLAALAGGLMLGAAAGVSLHSLGSLGGTDIIAVILNQRFNTSVGQVYFGFNAILFSLSSFYLDLDRILYSLAMTYVASAVADRFLGAFDQRRMVLIISDKADEIAQEIMRRLRRGVTFLYGRGGYTGRHRKVILTVVNNIQIKRMEELVYTTDPQAFTITGQTLKVLGKGFSRRRVL